MPRIVVGVDGSKESLHALGWAADEARLRGATLDVVLAYRAGEDTYSAVMLARELTAREQTQDRAMLGARELLGQAVAELDTTGLDVEAQVIEGPPARVLIDRSVGADLLVVGSRGRGGFTGLLLGSVSQQCMQHAYCAVAVVPTGG